MSDNTISVILTVTQLTGDGEKFKPSNPIIGCNLRVLVTVPLTDEYIANADFITSAKAIKESEPEPIFTVKGLRFIEEALLARQVDTKPQEKVEWSDEKSDTDNVQWSDDDFEF
jgi:hypothetical protein